MSHASAREPTRRDACISDGCDQARRDDEVDDPSRMALDQETACDREEYLYRCGDTTNLAKSSYILNNQVGLCEMSGRVLMEHGNILL